MGNGRQYPFKNRPQIMWTTSGTVAHLRESGKHVGLCGEFVDIFAQGNRGMDTLVAMDVPCTLCTNEILRRNKKVEEESNG